MYPLSAMNSSFVKKKWAMNHLCQTLQHNLGKRKRKHMLKIKLQVKHEHLLERWSKIWKYQYYVCPTGCAPIKIKLEAQEDLRYPAVPEAVVSNFPDEQGPQNKLLASESAAHNAIKLTISLSTSLAGIPHANLVFHVETEEKSSQNSMVTKYYKSGKNVIERTRFCWVLLKR